MDNTKKRKIEILAPAGSMESLRAAISAGADAVYIGGARFGARAFAQNPEEDELRRAIDYVHLRGKKLYLTVNTLLKERELFDELYHYLKLYYEQGLDAAIVQDMGVLQYISDEFPGLAIHASTQMSLTMAEGAKCFEGYPVTRLVNARELSLAEVRKIRENTDLEIESFVHGALCYCYSGQCLMSSLIGGRSGNRGRCAQPCRMEYEYKNGNGKYLLSPRDICTIDRIPELIEAGIDSFKIEGRMKRPEYTAGVAAAYKRETERYLELGAHAYEEYHKKNPDVLRQTMLELQDLYNRGGFSSGYYIQHNGPKMMSMVRPNHSGTEVGRVVRVKGNTARIKYNLDINAQDVLEIREGKKSETAENKPVYEFTMKDGHSAGEEVEARFTPGLTVNVNDLVYRTKNNLLLNEIAKNYLEKEAKIKINGRFYAKVDEPISLVLEWKADEKTAVSETFGAVAQQAQKQPMTEERIRGQLLKTGDTAYEFENLSINLEGDIFLPVSQINELRRSALEDLERSVGEVYRRESSSDCKSICDLQQTGKNVNGISVSVMTTGQLSVVLEEATVSRIYYDLAALPVEEVIRYAELAQQNGKELFLRLPQICRATTYDWLKAHRDIMLHPAVKGWLVRDYEEVYLFTNEWGDATDGRPIIADAMLYVMNRSAKKFFNQKGIMIFTAPYEQNVSELAELGVKDAELTVYGRLPLMTSAQCVQKNTDGCIAAYARTQGAEQVLEGSAENIGTELTLIDRKNKELPVKTFCKFCFNTIYNSQCLSILDCMEEIEKLQPAALRYDFTFETGAEVRDILEHGELPKTMGYTHGHFHRGVE